MTTQQHEQFDRIRAALERSAQALDADPAARPTPGFRMRGRTAHRGAGSKARPVTSTARVSRRLAASGVALLLFGLVAMPAFAGHGPAAGPLSTITSGIRHAVGGHASGNVDPDEATFFGTPGATPGMAFATPDPDWHGDAVSAAAHGTPVPGENHGEMVRQVAKDNHGHGYNGPATPTATGTTTTAGQAGVTPGVTEDNAGASDTATATSTTTATNRGQQQRQVAHDNHAHATATATAATRTTTGTTPTTGNGSGNGSNGNGQGSNSQGNNGQGNNGQGNNGQGNNGQGSNGQGNNGQGNNGHGH